MELDGGIDATKVLLDLAARASVLVAGTSVFYGRNGAAAGIKRLCAATT